MAYFQKSKVYFLKSKLYFFEDLLSFFSDYDYLQIADMCCEGQSEGEVKG